MSIGYVFSAVVGHLPVLAVLIAGLVLIGTRRARIGPRSAMFARFGAGLLLVAEVLQLGWSLAFPSLLSALDYDSTRYQAISIVVSVLLSLLFAVGIGMLIAAVVAGAPGAGGPGFAGPGFGGPGGAGPGFAGPGFAGPGFGGPGFGGPGFGGPGFGGPGYGGPGFSGPGAGGPGFSGPSPGGPGGDGPGYGGSGGGGPTFGPGPGFEPAPGQPTQRF